MLVFNSSHSVEFSQHRSEKVRFGTKSSPKQCSYTFKFLFKKEKSQGKDWILTCCYLAVSLNPVLPLQKKGYIFLCFFSFSFFLTHLSGPVVVQNRRPPELYGRPEICFILGAWSLEREVQHLPSPRWTARWLAFIIIPLWIISAWW